MLVIIGILAVVVAPVLGYLQARSQKVNCIANLRSLHTATSTYVTDHQQWPQLSVASFGDTIAAKAWMDALRPYGLEQVNWICPAVQKALQSPDLSDPLNTRVDYFATPFGAKRNAPFEYPRQPWFIEMADVHANGQEIIFPDGHIEEAKDIARSARSPSRP